MINYLLFDRSFLNEVFQESANSSTLVASPLTAKALLNETSLLYSARH